MNTSPPSRPSTLHQASRALGVPPDWLRKEAEAGRLPCLRAGDRLLFDLETIRSIVLDLARSGDPRREAGR